MVNCLTVLFKISINKNTMPFLLNISIIVIFFLTQESQRFKTLIHENNQNKNETLFF